MKKALLIAYHYPPARGSSGLQRTLKYSRYLAECGWQPYVLTVHPRAHPSVGNDQLAEIPPSVEVRRAFALDTARHLSVRGAYPGWLALPDRWMSWYPAGVLAGLSLIRRHRIDLIWSTYPIATAHKIGHTLARITGKPWVADFRDSMTEADYPPDPKVRGVYRALEAKTLRRCARAVFTTPGTLRMYRERYPDVPEQRLQIIENGYDEENFLAAQARRARTRPARPFTLIHSGILYPSERDPRAFFGALADLKAAGKIDSSRLQVLLRATGHDSVIAGLIAASGVEDIVHLAPSVAYEDALAEMLAADGLLLFQASNCNHQIPAKLYEYLRARRPILALTDPAGDTAGVIRTAGLDAIAPLDDRSAIAARLERFLGELESGESPLVTLELASRYSRRAQTRELASLFDQLIRG